MLSGLENPVHLLLVLVVPVAVFGAKRLPEMGRGLGSGLRGFKDALTSPDPPLQVLTESRVVSAQDPVGAPEPTPLPSAAGA